jgi:hypothetical protein
MLEGSERQMDLGQDARHAQDQKSAFRSPMFCYRQERRFPDPRFSADHEGRSTLIDPVDKAIDQGDVFLAALQADIGRPDDTCALCASW